MSLAQLRAGAAKYPVSPLPEMLPMQGYDAVREGEDIHVRALVVDNGEKLFLFEAFEFGGVPQAEELRERISWEFGIEKENILFSATHDHSAPHVISKDMPMMPGFEIPESMVKYSEYVIEQAIKAVADAKANLRPARYGYGEGRSYINLNRDRQFDDGYWMQGENYEGCSDKTLAVMKFVDEEGKLIAAVLNYAMHANVCFMAKDVDGKVKVTSDIPGIACDFVEEYYGNDAVVLWQSGAAGNQNPIFVNIKPVYDKEGNMQYYDRLPGMAYEEAVVLGQQHAMDAIRALKQIDADQSEVAIRTTESLLYFPTQKFPEGVDWNRHRMMVDNLLRWSGMVPEGEPLPEKELAEMIPCDEKAPMKAQLILFGDLAIYGVACELYNEIGMLCKEASPYKNLMITTHVGSPSAGYILDDASRGHKVFQSFGLVREGESNAIVVDGMLEMFRELINK